MLDEDGEGLLFIDLFHKLLEDGPEHSDVRAGLVESCWILVQESHCQVLEGVGAEAGDQGLDEGQGVRKVPIWGDEDPSLTQMVPQDFVIESVAIVGQQDDHAIIGCGLHPLEEVLGGFSEGFALPDFVHVKLKEVLHNFEDKFIRSKVAVKETGVEGLQAAHLQDVGETILGDESATKGLLW